MTPTELPFEEIWLHDFEFVSRPGERPDVVCLVAHELRSGRTLRLWRDELGKQPPYRTDRGVLFVSFVANAECACHLALGWPLPAHVLDLSPAFRNLTNGRSTPEGKGLLGALRYYGLDAIGAKQKDAMRERIMQGWPFTPEERAADFDLLRQRRGCAAAPVAESMLPEIDLGVALYHGEFAAVSALMEHRGVPIDMEMFRAARRQGHLARGARRDGAGDRRAIRRLCPQRRRRLDLQHGALRRLSRARRHRLAAARDRQAQHAAQDLRGHEQGLAAARGAAPAAPCARQDAQGQAGGRRRRPQSHGVVAVQGQDIAHAAEGVAVDLLAGGVAALADQARARNGRRLRRLLEHGISDRGVAVRSDTAARSTHMLDMYSQRRSLPERSPSVSARYRARPPRSRTRAVRDKYKVMLLATQYGMAAKRWPARLGVSTFEAHEMLDQHHELFAQYWQWSDDWVQHALQTGVMRTAIGWTCRTGITEFNERSIRNWPIQATGADILRIACILAARHGIKLLAPVHDAVLIEAPIERIEADVALMQEIMRRASRIVLNADATGTHELRTDAKIVRYPERYSDQRGAAIWDQVLEFLAEQRNQPAARSA